MKRSTTVLLGFALIALFRAAPAAAQERIVGAVIALQGQATAVDPDGASRALALKSPVRFRDTVRTAAGGILQIMFDDESVVSQGESSEMVIDTYLYNPDRADDSNCLLKFTKGLFRVVTGRITRANPDRFKVKTKMATIGIRGCEVGFRIAEDLEFVYIIELPDGLRIVINKDLLDAAKINAGQVNKADLLEILRAGIVVIIEEAGGMRRRVVTAEELRALILGTTPGNMAFDGFFLPGSSFVPPVGPFPGVDGGTGGGLWNNLPNPGIGLPHTEPPKDGGVPPGGTPGGGGAPGDGGDPLPQGEYKYVRYGSGTDWEWGFFGYVFPAGSDTLMTFERPEIRNNSVAGTFIGEAITETGFDPLLADLNIGSLTGEGISAAVVEGPVGTKQHMVGTCTLDLNLFGSGESDWNCLVAMGDAVNGLTFEAGGTVENGGMLTGAPGVRPDVTTTTPFALTVEGVRFNYQTITFEQFLGTVVGPGPSGPGAPVTGGILDFGILVNGGALLGGHSVVGIAGADTAARYNGSY